MRSGDVPQEKPSNLDVKRCILWHIQTTYRSVINSNTQCCANTSTFKMSCTKHCPRQTDKGGEVATPPRTPVSYEIAFPFCLTAPNPCTSNPCGDNGICLNSDGAFTCQCLNGYTGNLCQNGKQNMSALIKQRVVSFLSSYDPFFRCFGLIIHHVSSMLQHSSTRYYAQITT